MSELPELFVAVMEKLLQGNTSGRTGRRMLILVAGAIMAKGRRTVASALSVLGLSQCAQFGAYHRVLSRCVCSPHKLSQALLRALVDVFAPTGMIVVGLDDTIERRWGKRIGARGIYWDPVRSSRGTLSRPVVCAGSAACC